MNERQEGITALELLVTMTIATILLATGVPAIKDYGWNLRMKTAMDMLQTDLKLARGRAISHNTQTVVCPSPDASDCSGQSNWQEGWIVFTDINADRSRQEGEQLLKRSNAVELLQISTSRSRSSIRFHPNGSAPGSNLSIEFCDKRGAEHAGKIVVSNTGRIRSEKKAGKTTAKCP
jgi:type IV fimbrial biogenesis protein FimT